MDENREQPWNFHTCKYCSYRSKSTFLMCKHVRLHRTRLETDTFTCDLKTPETFECEICVFDANFKVNLTEHIRVFHEGKQVNEEQENILNCYRCKRCYFETHSLLVLTNHEDNCNMVVRSNSNERRGHNELWSVQIDKRYNFRRKSEILWFKCGHCEYKSRIKSNLKSHIIVKHSKLKDSDWFKCVKCSYKSKRQGYLRRHVVNKHTKPHEHNELSSAKIDKGYDISCWSGIQWFKCRQCKYKCGNKSSLKAHITRKHVNPKDINWFECVKCSYKCTHHQTFKRHILNKHTNPEDIEWFKCTHCDYKCAQKCELSAHIKMKHINPKDMKWFKCSKCLYKFKRPCELLGHVINKHTSPENIDWFKCTYCDYKSKRKALLNAHITVNHANPEDENWFKCVKCSYKTKLQIYLSKHIASKHAGPKKFRWFKCTKCNFKCKQNGTLKRHTAVKHTNSEGVV